MPPFVALAGALGSAAIVRWTYRTIARINDEIEAARDRRLADQQPAGEMPKLRRDPVSGIHRPT